MAEMRQENSDTTSIPIWHSLEIEEVLQKLSSKREGLSSDEARERLSKYGPNQLPPPSSRSPP